MGTQTLGKGMAGVYVAVGVFIALIVYVVLWA